MTLDPALKDTLDRFRAHPLFKPVLGGLLVGGIGLFFPQTLGVSYESIDACLNNQLGLWLAFLLVFVKILATSLTLGSGGSGGIFAPSLFPLFLQASWPLAVESHNHTGMN